MLHKIKQWILNLFTKPKELMDPVEEFSLHNKVKLLDKNIDIEFVHPLAILNVNEVLFQRFTTQEQLQILVDYICQLWIKEGKEENDKAFLEVVGKLLAKRRMNP